MNLKVSSPDVNFKIHSAWHSCGLQVALGLSGATPTAAAKWCYLKLPQGQLPWKEQFFTKKIRQNASSSLQFHSLPWGKEKEFQFLPFVHQVCCLGPVLERSGKFSAVLLTHWPWTCHLTWPATASLFGKWREWCLLSTMWWCIECFGNASRSEWNVWCIMIIVFKQR